MTNINPSMDIKPDVTAFFDEATNTISYVVKDPESSACAIIDSVMDIDYAAGHITYDHADAIITYINDHHLSLEWLIETHVHADHLSAAPYIQQQLGGKIGIGEKITFVQETFGMVHVMGNATFTGDTLFMPDGGSARADFPGGDAGELYDSIQKILSLPDDMRLFMCHDYGPHGRDIQWETTVADEKAHNIHVGGGKSRADFVKFRTERDAQLGMPKHSSRARLSLYHLQSPRW